MSRSRWIVLALLAAWGWAGSARAHGDSVSTLRLAVQPDGMHVVLTLAFRDLSAWVPPGEGDYAAKVAGEMRARNGELVAVTVDEKAAEPAKCDVSLPAAGSVQVEWTYATPGAKSSVEVRSLHLDRLPAGHHQTFYAEDLRPRPGKHVEGALLAQETLGVEQDSAVVEVPAGAVTSEKVSTPLPAAVSPGRYLPGVIGVGLFVIASVFIVTRLNFKAPAAAGPESGRN